MRNVIFLCLAILVGNSYAQTPLTNGEVYNYEVGDVIQTRKHEYSGSLSQVITITTKTILAKTPLPNDAVSYEVHKDIETGYMCFGCPGIQYSEETVTETYTNLSQPVAFPNDASTVGPQRCFNLGMADSITNCNRRLVTHYAEAFDSTYINCLEPSFWSMTYLQGVGMFYKNVDGTNGNFTETSLIAYTQNGVTCGNMLPVGTQNKTTALDLSVFPNPITNQLSIAGDAPIETYKIFDLNGACVQMGTISGKNIDVSALPKGNFIGVFYAPNGEFVRQKLTKL